MLRTVSDVLVGENELYQVSANKTSYRQDVVNMIISQHEATAKEDVSGESTNDLQTSRRKEVWGESIISNARSRVPISSIFLTRFSNALL